MKGEGQEKIQTLSLVFALDVMLGATFTAPNTKLAAHLQDIQKFITLTKRATTSQNFPNLTPNPKYPDN